MWHLPAMEMMARCFTGERWDFTSAREWNPWNPWNPNHRLCETMDQKRACSPADLAHSRDIIGLLDFDHKADWSDSGQWFPILTLVQPSLDVSAILKYPQYPYYLLASSHLKDMCQWGLSSQLCLMFFPCLIFLNDNDHLAKLEYRPTDLKKCQKKGW